MLLSRLARGVACATKNLRLPRGSRLRVLVIVDWLSKELGLLDDETSTDLGYLVSSISSSALLVEVSGIVLRDVGWSDFSKNF